MPGPATSASSEPASFEPRRLGLITWDDDSPTGGNVYNVALVQELRSIGVNAELVRVGPGWPEASDAVRRRLATALEQHPVSLVDGIVAGNAPEEILAAIRAGSRVSVLVHLPLADEPGLAADVARTYLDRERRSLAVAGAVICPSRHAAERIARRYGRPDAVVAYPGTRPGPIAAGSAPPRLLCLGAVTPAKNQLALLAALGDLTELPWTAWIVGSLVADAGYAAEVASGAVAFGGRVRLTGPLTGPALAETWAATDLSVLCSLVETYGLVVAEALGHGIPAIVPAGTGAVEALGQVGGLVPGRVVETGGLSVAVRDWLTDAELRTGWRRLALARRTALPSWRGAAEIVRAAVLG